MRCVHTYVCTYTSYYSADSTVRDVYVHTYVCMSVSVLYLLVKVLLQAVLQHCIKGRGGLGLELKAHNGTHLQGGSG